MTDASYPATLASPEAPATPKRVARRPLWQSFGIAVGSLVLVYGLGLLVMLAGGVVIHAFNPTKRIDIFAALHNQWVVGILLGITVLWLLPPYPWGKRVIAPLSQEQPAAMAGRTEGGGGGASTAHLDVPGPGPSTGQAEEQGAATLQLSDSSPSSTT
jgi:hypothetical protein